MQDNGLDTEEDRFKDIFKYYKRKKPPPDCSLVIDVNEDFKGGRQIPPCFITEKDQELAQEIGLLLPSSWKIYSINSHPGLLIICNPFTCQGQLQWIKRCLKEFPCATNKTNLASHGIQLKDSTWWQLTRMTEGRESGLQKKLRWVTLGYHHNWDTKEYSEDLRGEMPPSLVKLCSVVSKVLGFEEFRAEAAIINYYHQDSTLAAHTDHSEPYDAAPLFSFSFGQSAVFLIGGPTKATKPSAIHLHSGDVMVMSGTSRQAYHAVPRIVLVEEEPWNAEQIKQDECEGKVDISDNQESTIIWNNDVGASGSSEGSVSKVVILNEECLVKESTWNKNFVFNKDKTVSHVKRRKCEDVSNSSDIVDLLNYVKSNRINMNVRQVLMPSMHSLPR
ncbi:nucleic acid dioxygenase ALKBH1-like [Homarus americanus]|uniref:nucleic acid dioxygenase ALKBH1-like n=1 Tax=Homarus americanus TaxID=6706 RepID=UPI001C43D19C|nr:nucleic acid dioxygenase ALKBH1-like [Homarus americanus]